MAMNQKNNDPAAEDDRPVGTLDDESPIDQLDEQLVAYLDGELPPEERIVLEARLGRDSSLRKRLRTLQHGWDMLDELPMATPSAVFLESTIRMAAMEASQGKSSTNGSWTNGWLKSKRVWVSLITIFCLGVGVAGARVRERQQFRLQLSQLPVAMHVERHFDDADADAIAAVAESG
jgi:anti-sigma factor RsiW